MVLWEVQAASIEAMARPNGRRGGSGRPMDPRGEPKGAPEGPQKPNWKSQGVQIVGQGVQMVGQGAQKGSQKEPQDDKKGAKKHI